MRRFKLRLEYAAVRALDLFFSVLPEPLAFRLGEGIGRAASALLSSRNELIKRNLREAFPEKTPAEVDGIAKGVWRNLGRTAVEFILLPRLVARHKDRFERIGDGWRVVEAAGGSGILLTAHFTNWELTGALFNSSVPKVTAIARPIKNPYVDAWINRKRTAAGLTIIYHRDAVRAALRTLRANRAIVILFDQNMYTGGVFVNFFGRPAATTTLPALLHWRTGRPVILFYSLRTPSGYRLVAEQIALPKTDGAEAELIAHTQIINDRLEAVVRRTPENWFWIHNRWKRKPEPVPAPV
jgi:KDO2-lipid IV(A) lauroyltransferase